MGKLVPLGANVKTKDHVMQVRLSPHELEIVDRFVINARKDGYHATRSSVVRAMILNYERIK